MLSDLNTIPGKVVRLGDRGSTFVRDSGPGDNGRTPVVLLHGWTLTADAAFAPVYAALSRTRRVISLDLRSHGRGIRSSDGYRLDDAADDVIALLDELGIDSAILCGYSMGGGIAADAVSRYPERVRGTIIIGSAACYTMTARDRMIWRICRILTVLPHLGINLNPGVVISRLFGILRPCGRVRWNWMAGELRQTSLSDVLAIALEIPRIDLRPQLQHAPTRPSEMILTTKDQLCRPFMQAELGELLGSHVIMVPTGHHMPVSDPARFKDLLLDALGRLDRKIGEQDSRSDRLA